MVLTKRENKSSSSSKEKEGDIKYTSEQVQAVQEILKCGTDYYKVLRVEKKCTETDVKKSYRKLALQFHPDKNSAPQADEAFKLISKAFTVLSDPQQRAIHDAGGSDHNMRRGPGGPAFTSFGFNQRQGQEISPEELFNMFFGGNVQGFGPSGFSSATFYGPGFQTFTTRSGAGRRHPPSAGRPANASSSWTVLLQLLPLLILFGYSLFSGLLTDSTKAFSFQPSTYYSQPRMTTAHNVPYYVNPSSFRTTAKNAYNLARAEQQVETDWVRGLQHACQVERQERRTRLHAANGVFGIGRNEEKYQEALRTPLKSCDEIERFGYSMDY